MNKADVFKRWIEKGIIQDNDVVWQENYAIGLKISGIIRLDQRLIGEIEQ